MQNLFQTINYEYRKPNNFDGENSEFDVFKNIPSEICAEPKINFFSKVRIASNSVVFKYFKVIKESCINEVTYKKYSTGYRFFLKFIFPKINLSKKRFLLITDEWTSNYYHWHAFALARLLVLQQKNLLAESLIFLPKKYLRYKFVLPSLAKLGVKKDQLVLLNGKSNIKVNELVMASMSQQQPLIFRCLRDLLIKDAKAVSDFGDKIYISRADQVLRFVENENEIVDLLEKYGFKKLLIDKFSYEEQIAICSQAKYLVSPHGAGLTNIFFMKENSAILEMMTKIDERKWTDYYKLSDFLNIKYFCQECEMGPNSRVKDFHQASLVVDVKKLEKNLKLMLENE